MDSYRRLTAEGPSARLNHLTKTELAEFTKYVLLRTRDPVLAKAWNQTLQAERRRRGP